MVRCRQTRLLLPLLLILLPLILLPRTLAAQATTGAIAGVVTDGVMGRGLPGAVVSVAGQPASAATDREGRFRIVGVPAGEHQLLVTYVGRQEARAAVRVTAGVTADVAVALGVQPDVKETVTVTATVRDAQERALNQQKTASNITNVVSADQIGQFPDVNAAEVTQRIPGLSIQRDQGEGRYVIIRGTEPRLNSMMINGERIPAPEADVRSVALDVIPADLLQAVEVSKALLPDMDGDAIGGAVNLVTKSAPQRPMVMAGLGGGFNSSLSSADQNAFSLTGGGRFAGGRAGLIAAGSSGKTTRGNEDFEPVYTTGNLTDLDLRGYTVNRARRGVTTGLDFRKSVNTLYQVEAMYNYFIDDHEQRQRMRNRVANRRIERELRDRTHEERIWSVNGSGHQSSGRGTLEYHVQVAQSSQFDPGTVTTTFRQSNVNFTPNVTPTSIDPNNVQANPLNENIAASTFNSQVRAVNTNRDRDIVGGVDYRHLVASSSSWTAFFKVGAKLRDKDKARSRDESTVSSSATIPLSAMLQADGASHDLLDGRYAFGPFIDQLSALSLTAFYPTTSVVNHARDAEDFTTQEQTSAAYAMAELFVGSRLSLVPGVRVEHLGATYAGNDVVFSPSGAWVSTSPLTGKTSDTTVLPGINARMAIDDETNIRAAVTRSFARPNYISLIPNRTIDDQNNLITQGNKDLQPTLSLNTDLMIERYFKGAGLVSAGFFYKDLRDYIYTFRSTQTLNNELFTVTQPLNGDDASVLGLELVAQSQLDFLPSALRGIGVYLNYTYTDSKANFPDRPGETSTLPGQSKHVGNVAFSYERAGFTGRVAMNFHGSYIDQVGATAADDRYYDTHRQVDISFGQRLTPWLQVYVDALNLTDAPLRYFQAVPDRPLQEEHYKWWTMFGARITWNGR